MSAQDCLNNSFNIDPDITGLGVRINLYASSLIIAILPETPLTHPLIDVCRANATMSGFALLVTAIVRTAQHRLTLYHAIFILHMLFFLGIGVFPTGRYKATSPRRLWTLFITVCVALMFQSWALYIWATAPTFGPQDTVKCNNQIKYIFVFASVRATALWVRVLWMVVLGMEGIGILLYLLSLLVMFLSKTKGQTNGSDSNSSRLKPSQFLLLLSCIYAVAMLELYVKRNKHLEIPDDDETWTFGQIISLVMIASTFNEVLHFLLAFLPSLSSRPQRDEGANAGTPLDTVAVH